MNTGTDVLLKVNELSNVWQKFIEASFGYYQIHLDSYVLR